MPENNNTDNVRRLDVIIGLLLDLIKLQSDANKISSSDTQRIARVKQLGLGNDEIATIFGRKSSEIAKLAYEAKRKKK